MDEAAMIQLRLEEICFRVDRLLAKDMQCGLMDHEVMELVNLHAEEAHLRQYAGAIQL